MLDVLLSSALAALTILMGYLGVHVTLHPKDESPREQLWYKVGFIGSGILAVSLVVIQGVRTLKTQQANAEEVAGLNLSLGSVRGDLKDVRSQNVALQGQIQGLQGQVQGLTSSQQTEIGRREEAEKNFIAALKTTGNATRQGVAEDIRKAPIQVDVNGQPVADPAEREKRKKVRAELGSLLGGANFTMQMCINDAIAKEKNQGTPDPSFSCRTAADHWAAEAFRYIQNNMESSYTARFVSAAGGSWSWGHGGQDVNEPCSMLKNKSQALEEFIKELRD